MQTRKGSPDLRNNKHDAARYVRMKFALEYVLRSHNSGNSQLGILALHLVKEAAERKVSAVHSLAFLPLLGECGLREILGNNCRQSQESRLEFGLRLSRGL